MRASLRFRSSLPHIRSEIDGARHLDSIESAQLYPFRGFDILFLVRIKTPRGDLAADIRAAIVHQDAVVRLVVGVSGPEETRLYSHDLRCCSVDTGFFFQLSEAGVLGIFTEFDSATGEVVAAAILSEKQN